MSENAMLEKFTKAMLDLFGKDYEYAINVCIIETYAHFGEPITLNDLFVVWGEMCEHPEDMM